MVVEGRLVAIKGHLSAPLADALTAIPGVPVDVHGMSWALRVGPDRADSIARVGEQHGVEMNDATRGALAELRSQRDLSDPVVEVTRCGGVWLSLMEDWLDAADGTRLPVTAYVGTTPWAQFHVDLVGSDVTMTGEPEDVPPVARVVMPGIDQHGYRAYPLVDHVADKVAATFDRYGDSAAPSTRYKDLVDVVAITTVASVEAQTQLVALASEAERRGITLPQRFGVPARDLWERGYAAEARRSLLPVGRTLEEALAVVTPFLDPLLDATAVGTWDPKTGRWVA